MKASTAALLFCVVIALGSSLVEPINARWAGSPPPSWIRLATYVRASQKPKQTPRSTQTEQPSWNAMADKSFTGYRITSVTNLAGISARQDSQVEISSGVFRNWKWKVAADSSVLPSWTACENAAIFKRSKSLATDDWSYPAFDWNRAFARTYLLAKYLLGREPAALNASVLLIPEGQEYQSTLDQIAESDVPIAFGFPFPTDASTSKSEQAKRMGAILQAVTEMAHQYSRVLVDENVISTAGQGEASKKVNKEADGACWMESTAMVFMAANGHFRSTMQWNQQSSADDLEHHPPSTIPPDKVGYWASLREAESISGYLEMKGMKNRNFSSKDPTPMNAVLSVCRAMTQRPVDLTAGPYPPSQIQFVPFFPDKLK